MVGWFLLALLAPASFALTNNLAALIDPPETPVITFASGIVAGGGDHARADDGGAGRGLRGAGAGHRGQPRHPRRRRRHHQHVRHLPHHRARSRAGVLLAVQLRGGGGGARLGHPLLRREPQRLRLGRRGADAGGRRAADPRGAETRGGAGRAPRGAERRGDDGDGVRPLRGGGAAGAASAAASARHRWRAGPTTRTGSRPTTARRTSAWRRSAPATARPATVPGLRVALLLENRPDFHLHWWALNAPRLRHRSRQPRIPAGTR